MISCNSSIETKEKVHYSVISNNFFTEANMYDIEKQMRSDGVSSELISKTIEGLNNEVQNDTTFLNYIFGMSKKEFEFHSNGLVKKGILKETTNSYTYLYKMSIPSYDKHEMVVDFSFYQDFLHTISLKCYAPPGDTFDSFMFYYSIVDLYEKKYSKSHNEGGEDEDKDEDEHYIIPGNKVIRFNQFKMHPITGINKKRITITYKNIAILLMEEYQRTENKKLEDSKTIEDI